MRISRHQMFMQMAEVASRRATCFRRSVGAIIVKDKNIVSLGYNGPPAGEPHCTGATCPVEGVCSRAVHAEANALDRLKSDWSDENLVMYVTESPCMTCADKIIHDDRIRTVYFLNPYRDPSGVDYLTRYIQVFRMTPAGYVIDYKSGVLVEDIE